LKVFLKLKNFKMTLITSLLGKKSGSKQTTTFMVNN